MARSEDPTTYSQAFLDAQQGYTGVDPLTQQPHQAYDPNGTGHAGTQPAAIDPYAQPATYAVAPEAQYADPYQQPTAQPGAAVDSYPPLDLGAQSYEPAPAVQAYQPQAQPDAYTSYDPQAMTQPQGYQQQPQSYQPAAPQAYEQAQTQPHTYQQVEPVTQPTQPYVAQPQTYAEPAQSYAPVAEQPAAAAYADYAAPQVSSDPYAAAAQTSQPLQYDQLSAREPLSPLGTQNDYASHHQEPAFGTQEPVFGGVHQDYATQTHVPAEQYQPQTTDPYAYQQQATELPPRQAETAFLDPGLFAQPEPASQTAPAGSQGIAYDHLGHPIQQPAPDPSFAANHGYGHQQGYDQRFDPQVQGYDQRFEQPTQGHYDGGLVGELGPQDDVQALDMGAEMAPVVADQQLEPTHSRRGLIVVGALVAAVGIGGALGFAYKYSKDGGRQVAANPPTIKASRTAAKQAPKKLSDIGAGQGELLSKRLKTNRAAETSTTRVVSREEPLAGQQNGVTLRKSTSGRTNTGQVTIDSLGNRAKQVAGVRRVKTLKVNPDGTFATPSTGGLGDSDLVIPGATLGPIPTVKKVQAKRISVKKALENQAARLPKLAAKVPQPKPVTPRKRVASLDPTVPATTASGGGGLGYVVQVSARRSRIDALAAFADLQQRFTGALGTKQPDIQEVNLGGTRGKWYRVRIGPPGSKNAAYNLCNRLKQSGLKDCLIKAY